MTISQLQEMVKMNILEAAGNGNSGLTGLEMIYLGLSKGRRSSHCTLDCINRYQFFFSLAHKFLLFSFNRFRVQRFLNTTVFRERDVNLNTYQTL